MRICVRVRIMQHAASLGIRCMSNEMSHFKSEADLLLLVVCHLGHCLVCKQVGMLKQMGQAHCQAEQDMVVGLRYRYL